MLVARESVDRVVCVGKSDAPDLTGGTNMSGIDCLTLVTRNLLQAQTDRPCRRKLSSNHPAGSPWLAQRGVRSSTSMNYLVLTHLVPQYLSRQLMPQVATPVSAGPPLTAPTE